MTDLPEKERKAWQEKHLVVEIDHTVEIAPGLEGYIEKVEKGVELKKPVTDGQGQVLVTSPAAQKPKIVLPIREDSYFNPKNWHKPVVEAIRWLLTWTKRIIKMYPGRTSFEQ